MDRICIDDLKVFAHHGVFEHENINGQNFYVNAVLYVETEKAGLTDELEYSVDYGMVCGVIENAMTEHTYKLIESAAQNVAMAVLKCSPLINRVDIEVRKPEAPIDMEFRSVSVKISRSWHNALIAVGSNMGDSREIISEAVRKLEESEYIRDLKQSSLIVTKPYGYTEQDDFLNGAVLCRTVLSPHGLLDLMHRIENEAGRTREIHWGPRTLDLDLIFYDRAVISDPDLIVPHPDMHNRDFVLKPAAELMPDYVHPVLGARVSELLERLNER
ncbi:MAG: 2-amino-4-hydroxy-6-hydroxymethyldihydropteridine diphosphokinase [Ruminococcus sp.]|nr:2-amino-4-hydroxy-6-hydroxymethyldihydropteridine diphosphokinase [Ruminococcus sp.]